MFLVRISLFLLAALSVSFGGSLEEKWFKDLKKAQESYRSGEAPSSSLNTTEFQTKKFNTAGYHGSKENGLQRKMFTTRESSMGRPENNWGGKKFSASNDLNLSGRSSSLNSDQTFSTGRSSLGDTRVSEDKRAREEGIKAVLEREKSVLSDMRYQGVEAAKIAQEIKLINDTLKNKDDLKDHRISIQEIREILNKN